MCTDTTGSALGSPDDRLLSNSAARLAVSEEYVNALRSEDLLESLESPLLLPGRGGYFAALLVPGWFASCCGGAPVAESGEADLLLSNFSTLELTFTT